MRKQVKVWLCCLTFVFAVSFYTVLAYASSTSSAQDLTGTGGNVNGLTASEVQRILDEQSKAAMAASSKASSAPSSRIASSSRRASSFSSSGNGDSSSVSSGDTSGGVSSGLASDPAESNWGSSNEISLPSVGSVEEENPLSSVIVNPQQNQQMSLIGIISWICILLGVVVVLAVVFSNRRPPRGGSGRKRYCRQNRSNKKHLLNDKYYRHMRY